MRVDRIFMQVNPTQLGEMLLQASNVGIGRSGDVLVKYLKQSFTKTSMRVPSPPGSPPGTVTNRLRNSIQATIPENGSLIVGTNERYARVQEYGGVLKPRKSKALTIPLNFDAAEMRARAYSLRTYKNLAFRPMFGQNIGLLVQVNKSGRGKKHGRPMFLLRRSVRLPARPYLRPAARNQTVQGNIAKAFKAGFTSMVRWYFKNMVQRGAPIG